MTRSKPVKPWAFLMADKSAQCQHISAKSVLFSSLKTKTFFEEISLSLQLFMNQIHSHPRVAI